MPEIVERFVSEIVAQGEPGENYTQSVDSQSLASQMLFEGKPQLLSVDQFSRDSVEALFRVADTSVVWACSARSSRTGPVHLGRIHLEFAVREVARPPSCDYDNPLGAARGVTPSWRTQCVELCFCPRRPRSEGLSCLSSQHAPRRRMDRGSAPPRTPG